MLHPRDIPVWAWEIAMLACAMIWGGSFVIIKGSLDVAPACWLMGVRFLLASVVLGAFAWRKLRDNLDGSHIVAGALLGVLYGAGYAVQNVGLTYTTPGRNAFLTTIYCVLVPFINWIVTRRRPGAVNLVAAGLCVVGVALLSLGDDLSLALGLGDALSLLSGVFFATQIVFVDRFTRSHDMMTISVVQLVVMGLTCFAFSLALGEKAPDVAALPPSFWWSLAYLVLLSSCFATVVQNLGQAVVPPAQSALLLSLESVFAVIASVLFANEQLTVRLCVGFALIFVAVLTSELGPGLLARRADEKRAAAERGA